MATLEEKAAAIRARREQSQTTPRVSMEERAAAIRARREQPKETPQEVAPTPVDPDSASSIIGRSVDQMQGSVGGAIEAVGEATGSEYLQQVGADYRKEQQEEASQYGAPSIASYKGVDFENPEQVGTFLKQMGLSTTPSIGVGVAGAVGGAQVGGRIAGPKGAVVGGTLGAIMSSLPLNIGEVQNAIKEIDPEAKSPWAAILGGTAMSTLDLVGLTSIAKPLVKAFGKDVAYQALKEQGVLKEVAAGAVKGALAEAPTEAAQSVIGDYSAATGTNTTLNTEKVIENAINNAIGGALGGSIASGATHGVGAIQNNQIAPDTAVPGADFEEGRKKSLNMAQRAWDALGSESTALIEPVARVSPEFKGIIRKFRPDMTGETASAPTVFEDADLMVGKWTSKMEQDLRGEDLDTAIDDYLEGKSTKGAKAFKEALDDTLSEAKKAGLDVGQIKQYLPTRLDQDSIVANREQFIKDIAPYVKTPEVAVDNWIAQQSTPRGNTVPQVDRGIQLDANGQWVAAPQYRRKKQPETFRHKFAQGTIPPEFGHLEKSRAFGNVPQKVLQKWTKEQSGSEIMTAMRDYFEGAAHRIAFAKNFGPMGEKVNFQVAKGVKEAQSKGYNPTKQEVDRVYDLLDAYNGMYHRIQSEGLKTTVSTVSALATMKALPLSVLSSLVEIATPAIRGDIKSALIEIAPTIAQVTQDVVRTILRQKVPRNEFSKFASEANITLQSSLNIASERLGANVMSRGATKSLKWFFLANGLTLMTSMQSTYAARVGDRIFKDNIRKLAEGLPVTSAKGAHLANQLRSMGVPVYSNEDAKVLHSPLTLSQRETANQYRRLAIRRFKDQAILEPNIADTPMWMSNGHISIFALLGRYPAAFGNIILPAIARKVRPSWAGSRTLALQGAASAAFILGFMLMVGYLQDELKLQMKHLGEDIQDDRTDAQRFIDVVNSTLVPLQVSKVLDFFAAPRYGRSGADTLAGPVVGMGTDLGKTISSFAEDPNEGEIWQYLYKQSPAQFYRPGREAAKEVDLFDWDD